MFTTHTSPTNPAQVWNRCVESVVCETNVESYAVSADEFYLLFNHDNEIDQITFDEMRRQEVRVQSGSLFILFVVVVVVVTFCSVISLLCHCSLHPHSSHPISRRCPCFCHSFSFLFLLSTTKKTMNFRMDLTQDAPTEFGVPLYMTFSCVSVTCVSARNIMAADTNIIGKGSSDPYVVSKCREWGSRGRRGLF